jgi:lysine-specific demethylase/histidyl-hydroxylase NO66
VRDGQTLAPETYTRSARIQSRTISDVIDPGRVLHYFAHGATVVLQAVHRYWTPVAHFCRELEAGLTHPVQTNVYLTPPSARGLDIHYDTHDVFVLQTSGVKHWQVWGSARERPLPHQRRRGRIAPPGPPAIDVELKPGDSLYIPRGVLHGAETTARESAHMTVGVLAVTWVDVVKQIAELAADQTWLREALPAGFAHDPDSLRAPARAVLARLGEWIEGLDGGELLERQAARFWSARTPLLAGQLEQLLGLDEVDDDSLIRRRRGATAMMRPRDDAIELVLGDRTLAMPAHVEPAVRLILERDELHVAELEPWLDEAGRSVLVRRLVAEGLVERQSGGDLRA